MAELDELLLAAAGVDDRRYIASRRITVGEHFALGAGALRSVTGEAFYYTVRLRPPTRTDPPLP
jgi:hypothetical protein